MGTEVSEATKSGEWYTVQGNVNGKRVSVDIPANYIDGKSRDAAQDQMKRALETISRMEP